MIQIIDNNTNELFNYLPVTVWADGTAMNDSKVDGDIDGYLVLKSSDMGGKIASVDGEIRII